MTGDASLLEELDGPWEHALFLSYTLGLPFFESWVWRSLPVGCRNRVILADGARYLEEVASEASTGLLRLVNRAYVCDGLFLPVQHAAAHGKVILLAGEESGRLIVGSANLTHSGFWSAGELVCRYEVTVGDRAQLAAFTAIRELLIGLLRRGWLQGVAGERVEYLLQRVPWLHEQEQTAETPVRHNLDRPLLDQLVEAVAGKPVDELILLAPFFDPKLAALRAAVTALQPRRVRVLVQPGYTSADPAALGALAAEDRRLRVATVAKDGHKLDLHAKLIVIRSGRETICLQGSPNLTRAALLGSAGEGNLEVANLLRGGRDLADRILGRLSMTDIKEPGSLRLALVPIIVNPLTRGWHLVGGDWTEDRVVLRHRGPAPSLLSEPALVIEDLEFPVQIVQRDAIQLVCNLPSEAVPAFRRTAAAAFMWSEGEARMLTNRVFLCDRSALAAMLEQSEEEADRLNRFGALELNDPELVDFLRLIAESLVLDDAALLAAGGRPLPNGDDGVDQAQLDQRYEEIDFDALRKHPKVLQYQLRHRAGGGYARTALQVLLAQIAAHYDDLTARRPGPSNYGATSRSTDEGAPEEGEDTNQVDERTDKTQRHMQQRLQAAFRSVFRRYLRGARSGTFRDRMGAVAMTANHAIAVHLLRLLLVRTWLDQQELAGTIADVVETIWGEGGYLAGLPESERATALRELREHRAEAELVSAVVQCSRLARQSHWLDTRVRLRDAWRSALTAVLFPLNKELASEASVFLAEITSTREASPAVLVEELRSLAVFETRESFIRWFEEKVSPGSGRSFFEKVKVHRAGMRTEVTIECLFVPSTEPFSNPEAVSRLLRRLMDLQLGDYHRLQYREQDGWMGFWDSRVGEGLCLIAGREAQLPRPPELSPVDWAAGLKQLASLADTGPPHALTAAPAADGA